jgi:ABC-type multidrug transport system fused ATPase/permease subunit
MILFTIFLLGLGITESIYPYFYKLFIDAIPSMDAVLLLKILFGYVGLRILKLVLDVATYFMGDSALLAAARDIRMAVFKKIQDLDFAYHLTKSTGSMISSIKRGDLAAFNLFHIVNIRLVRISISFIVLITLFFQLKVEIALLMLGTMILNSFFAYFLIKRNIKARVLFNKTEDNVSEVIVDNLINFETVKFFAKELVEYNRLGSTFTPWFKALWDYANSFRLIDVVIGITGNLSLFGVLYLGLQYLLAGEITAGDYVMILGFVNSFYGQFFDMVFQMRDVAKNNADLESYFSVFNYETMVLDPKNPKKLDSVDGEIIFDGVGFSYPEGREHALKDFTFKINPGESVAFVGHSGAGKTTITKLLMRFYDPNNGAILIDGVNIKDITKSNLREFMGIVPQEPILFNESIAYNIGYGAGTTDMKEIEVASKMANLDEFIDDLPEGYDTKVGERGVRLSGGQKQRLAIARMILSNPDIIIFDEATSQLDSQSEKLIQDAFWKVSKNKTTVIIAHRLSSITKADKIVVMENGQIAEVGTHKALLAQKGLYSKFWKLQTFG